MALGSYNAFINSMLNLREQRLQEERYKQLERMENQKQMMSMVGDIGSGISSAFQQGQQNKMANALMEEQVRRAAASWGSQHPWSEDVAAGKPGFYTGGMPELKMRMAMNEDFSQARYRDAMISRMGEDLKFKKSDWLVKQAEKAGTRQTTESGKIYDDGLAYITKRQAAMDAVENAEDPEQHQTAVNALTALDMMAKKEAWI